jgi:hypothetical protein
LKKFGVTGLTSVVGASPGAGSGRSAGQKLVPIPGPLSGRKLIAAASRTPGSAAMRSTAFV